MIFSSLAAWETVTTLSVSIFGVITLPLPLEEDPVLPVGYAAAQGLKPVRRVRIRQSAAPELAIDRVLGWRSNRKTMIRFSMLSLLGILNLTRR